MKTAYGGIDVGQNGGICILYDSNNIVLYDMPILRVKKGKKIKKKIDEEKIRKIIFEIDDSIFIHYIFTVEVVHAMSKQGVTSTFNFGYQFGFIIGILTALGLDYKLVTPQSWKKEFGLIGKDKKESVKVAMELFPNAKDELITPRGRLIDGRAEALLIAEYTRRKEVKNNG